MADERLYARFTVFAIFDIAPLCGRRVAGEPSSYRRCLTMTDFLFLLAGLAGFGLAALGVRAAERL